MCECYERGCVPCGKVLDELRIATKVSLTEWEEWGLVAYVRRYCQKYGFQFWNQYLTVVAQYEWQKKGRRLRDSEFVWKDGMLERVYSNRNPAAWQRELFP